VKGIEGRLVVVTGASSGIGLAATMRLADAGARIIAVSDRPEELSRLASTAGVLATVTADISVPEQVDDLGTTVANLGGADILVNNAGIWSESGPLDLPLATWRRTLDVNVTGPFLCSQVFARQMRDRGGGAIVNTASTNGLVAEPNLVHYNTSKGALVMMTKSLAVDLAPYRIRVNAVAPGVIRTPLIADLLDAQPVDHFRTIPLGEIGLPEQVADCIIFLASDAASYVTGEILVCDGGQLALNGYPADRRPHVDVTARG
jgi:NAD(P)-dependent dehydrogenase (short-subunit alcohol dehydrogenase family)